MSPRTRVWVILAGVALFVATAARWRGVTVQGAPAADKNSATAAPTQPSSTSVLVELFTSEGCSSCPPADALLMRLGRTQPVRGADVIVLEEHVNYWDRLGWKDPFSSEAATERQREYAGPLDRDEIYTPQMVVDGRAKFVGSSESEALHAVRVAGASPKPAVALSWTQDGQLSISVPPLANAGRGAASDVYLAITESRLQSDVKHGENSGQVLKHDGVVRQLSIVGQMESGASEFTSTIPVRTPPEWNRANLRAVVFVQDKRSLRILAAAEVLFPA
jgi:hypothetical protein